MCEWAREQIIKDHDEKEKQKKKKGWHDQKS